MSEADPTEVFFYHLERAPLERVRTTDITAAGGNAALLSLAPERKA